jgi:trigger factor
MFPQKFEETLTGVSPGEEKEFTIDFPSDYRSNVLAGETIGFTVKVREIKVKELPDLDDDFAGEISRFDSITDLRSEIKTKLDAFAKARADMGVREKIVEQLVSISSITVPEVLVDRKIARMIESLGRTLQSEGVTIDDYLERTGGTMDSLREQYQESAVQEVKHDIVLKEIVKQENINVPHEELDQRIVEMAESTNQDVERLRSVFANTVSMAALKDDIAREKAMDFLVEHADIKDVVVKQEEE